MDRVTEGELHNRYREPLTESWRRSLPITRTASAIAPDATEAVLLREKNAHKGIGEKRHLRTLIAGAVHQPYLDEIGQLEMLERLDLGWPTTAQNLDPLRGLKRLRYLKIDSPRNVSDFSALYDLPALETLFIENAKHVTGLEFLAPLKQRLKVLGVEGSMWTYQKLDSLAPLAGFAIEALFLTTVRLKNRDLSALASCPNLSYMRCARFAPKEQFDRLKALRPDMQCSWFDEYELEGE